MTRTLLLADNSHVIQGLVERGLAGENFELIASSSGDEALALTRSERPDIVLVDVGLPGLNGYEVCESIKNTPALAEIPVVLLAGAFEPYDAARALDAGADDHITKPFETQSLVSRLDSLLAGRGLDPLLGGEIGLGDESEILGPSADPIHPSRRPEDEFVLGDDLEVDDAESPLDIVPLPDDNEVDPEFLDDIFDFGEPLGPVPESLPEAILGAGDDVTPGIRADLGEALRETLETYPGLAVGDDPESMVKALVAKVEAVAWEVIPQMAETLIREEIRRMKEGDE